MLHLCAAGGWIGGLASLTIFLARVRAPFLSGEAVAPVLHRFSTLSLCCVSLLVVSGISNSWLLVGSIYALFTTPYGQLLLKLLKAPAEPDLLLQLRRNVFCEICLGVAVVAIVACLGVTPPPRHL